MMKRIKATSFEMLYKVSELVRVPKVMTGGKHKGMAIKDLPASYKRWLLEQPNTDKYMRKAILGA